MVPSRHPLEPPPFSVTFQAYPRYHATTHIVARSFGLTAVARFAHRSFSLHTYSTYATYRRIMTYMVHRTSHIAHSHIHTVTFAHSQPRTFAHGRILGLLSVDTGHWYLVSGVERLGYTVRYTWDNGCCYYATVFVATLLLQDVPGPCGRCSSDSRKGEARGRVTKRESSFQESRAESRGSSFQDARCRAQAIKLKIRRTAQHVAVSRAFAFKLQASSLVGVSIEAGDPIPRLHRYGCRPLSTRTRSTPWVTVPSSRELQLRMALEVPVEFRPCDCASPAP
ncbi:hypothetical protein L227DRAFT_66556 [Lentinus tigrinus ALCF2SS1-6]|uniref:Uncharacterized protein n=1 Tax=Lentinus tigrinus ALCF2SS1-6 TaxID=1328759 RepID=A0A5C2SC72_9APHY|nr:hypothetical protein L227DRAFT_66556 [Lentinus tigrinus ALCF2SS1-6]